MGSRLMHFIIGEMVASSLDVKNKRDFLVGSIAPDAAFSFERKVITHYFEGDVDKRTRQVLCHYDIGSLKDWLRFDALPREIDNVTKEDLQIFIDEMYGDFEIIEKNKDCELEVYKFNDIIMYINFSKSKAIDVIEKITC
ncbi:hypothetical protein D3C73_669020 [compost metagenome]